MTNSKGSIGIAKSEYQLLRGFLGNMPSQHWSMPSLCQGWTISDVVAHLIATTAFQASMVHKGLQGLSQESESSSPKPRSDQRRSIQDEAISLNKQLGGSLLSAFDEHYDMLLELFDSLTPQQLEMNTRHPIGEGGIVQVRTYIDLCILETALHGWDIRGAFDLSARLSPSSSKVLVDYIVPWLRRMLHPRSNVPLRFRFHITDADLKTIDLVIQGDQFWTELAKASIAAAATMSCDLDTYLLIHFGRLTFSKAQESGRLSVQGDAKAVQLLDDWIAAV